MSELPLELMSEPILELENVCAGYGPIEALKGISLVVTKGEIVALIGANGAGKTSTLCVISRLLALRAGRLRFDGQSIERLEAHELVARGISHVPEGRKIFSRLSVKENLELGAFVRGDRAGIRRDLEKVYTLFPILAERRGQLGGTLSGGEQQMLAIGRGLMSGPRLLLLDEPSMGIAPIIVRRIFDALVALNREGLSMLLVEQNATLALATASRGYVIETGVISFSGDSNELCSDPRVIEAYLGESAI